MRTAFESGLQWAAEHGSEAVRERRRATDDLGIAMLIEGWQDAPVTPESVGRELFGDESILAGRPENYMRDFVRGVLCY